MGMNDCPNCGGYIYGCGCPEQGVANSLRQPSPLQPVESYISTGANNPATMPTCFCGQPLEISPPIPEGQEADRGQTYNFLCPVHSDATSAESNYRRMVEAEAERDELRDKGEQLCGALGHLMLEARHAHRVLMESGVHSTTLPILEARDKATEILRKALEPKT